MMRTILIAASVLFVAACGDGTSPTAPAQSHAVPVAAAPSRALSIAVADIVDRLLPSVAGDAAQPIGATLRDLSVLIHEPTTSSTALRDAVALTRETVARFRAPGRLDMATLDAIALELDVDR